MQKGFYVSELNSARPFYTIIKELAVIFVYAYCVTPDDLHEKKSQLMILRVAWKPIGIGHKRIHTKATF